MAVPRAPGPDLYQRIESDAFGVLMIIFCALLFKLPANGV